ncbi:class I SAM-dependent methyltransferase [Synechocystis sp. PCC 7339]|uniref:class I SAM-dependent methyltransferase n=1 Tax=unclassified Synechocystis TaxID=2640012 RepID=UPI001BB0AC54|nr:MULTISPECIES: class I SAM-dependent methyltransferase [unclassified Synechocystis]QUS59978.1 class I SAM-dependent methyltransferase [Synechocystis sp. PCC 7338]UAJ72570.1 class I SAM-dependent methyltransferase [Synechocystis sp. PCC 7339]
MKKSNSKNTIKCPICNSDKTFIKQRNINENILRTTKNYTYIGCKNCNTSSLFPFPEISELQEHYQFIDNQSDKSYIISFLSNEINLSTVQYLESRQSPNKLASFWHNLNPEYPTLNMITGGKVLDLGSGSGSFCKLLKEKEIDFVGVEQSENSVKIASLAGIDLIQDDIFSVSQRFPNSSFDYITLNHVIEHIVNPIDFLHSIRSLLVSPTGQIILALPNLNSISRFVFRSLWHGWDPPIHVHHYNSKSIEFILDKAGYKIVSIYTNTKPDGFSRSLNKLLDAKYRFLLLRILIFPFLWFLNLFGLGDELIVIAKLKDD